MFSSTMLTQQSALRSVHPLSNERGDETSAKHCKPLSTVDGLIDSSTRSPLPATSAASHFQFQGCCRRVITFMRCFYYLQYRNCECAVTDIVRGYGLLRLDSTTMPTRSTESAEFRRFLWARHMEYFPSVLHDNGLSRGTVKRKPTRDPLLRCRRGTSRRPLSVEILVNCYTTAQKSHLKMLAIAE